MAEGTRNSLVGVRTLKLKTDRATVSGEYRQVCLNTTGGDSWRLRVEAFKSCYQRSPVGGSSDKGARYIELDTINNVHANR